MIGSNKLLKEIAQRRATQISNILISSFDNIILYSSSFYIGRMIQMTLSETNERQITKILEDVASNPSIDGTYSNVPFILFCLTALMALGAI